MKNAKIDFIMNVSKFNTIITKFFDSKLWGLWFNDFIVLYYLDNSSEKSMKRIDLAEKVWLTASGITRLLLPMEKIWLVKKETNSSDARVSLVSIAPWWKEKLKEAYERMEMYLDENIDEDEQILLDFSKFLKNIWSNFLWK